MPIITIKYGASQELLCNSNVTVQVLLGYVKKQCQFDFAEPIDLATEAGEVLDLNSKSKEYAVKHMEKGVLNYIAVKIVDEESGDLSHIPLLDSVSPAIRFLGLVCLTAVKDGLGRGVRKELVRERERPGLSARPAANTPPPQIRPDEKKKTLADTKARPEVKQSAKK